MRKLYKKLLRWAFLKYIQKNKVGLTQIRFQDLGDYYDRGDLLQDAKGNLYVYLGEGNNYHLTIYEED